MPAISAGLAIGLGALSAGTSIVGGVLAKKGAESQAQAAERSTALAVAENRRQFDISRADLAPWKETGSEAIRYLAFLMGLGPDPNQQQQGGQGTTGTPINFESLRARFDERSAGRGDMGGRNRFAPVLAGEFGGPGDPRRFSEAGAPSAGTNRFGATLPGGTPLDPSKYGSLNKPFEFEEDPGYQRRLEEGQKAVERSAAARGGLVSGRTGRELTRFGQEFASDEYGRAWNRDQAEKAALFNRYGALSGVGQVTASQLADLGSRYADQYGNLVTGGATSAAAARAAGSAALGQSIGNAGNSFMNWYLMQKAMQQKPTDYGYPGVTG